MKRELVSTKASDIKASAPSADKNNVWVFDPARLTLTYSPKRYSYEIDLEECTSSAELLDWIFQVYKKNWCTQKVIADLIQQFHVIFDPQANYCSGGYERAKGKMRLRKRLLGSTPGGVT